MPNLTIAITTFNRPQTLLKCLRSLTLQTTSPSRILIIDNHPSQNAKTAYKQYATKLPIKYLYQPKNGVPTSRNLAIQECKSRFLGFIDDDCLVHKDWVHQALSSIKQSSPAYVVGYTKLLNIHSKIAQAQYIRHTYWFNHKISGNTTSPFNFDTKNIILDTKAFKKNKLHFDPNIKTNHYDSADTDMGFQLQKLNLKGHYNPNLLVQHPEVESLLKMLHKAYFKGHLASKIATKWKIKGEFVNLDLLNPLRFIKSIKQWPQQFREMLPTKNHQATNVAIFTLIKLYDHWYTQGYASNLRR